MLKWFILQEPWVQALIAGMFTWLITGLGAALVFFVNNISKRNLSIVYGFSSGVMIASSIWSLLTPGIEWAQKNASLPSWFVVSIGFSIGGLFLYSMDKLSPHIHPTFSRSENKATGLRKSAMLFFSITLHNIPEGLAIGVAFGAISRSGDYSIIFPSILSALALAIGIGIQNFPEGAAISIPLEQEGMSKRKSFFYGQISAFVEPIMAVIGAILVSKIIWVLPYALSFAAGAMVYVVIEELLPEAQFTESENRKHYAIFGFMVGFVIMMILDVALS